MPVVLVFMAASGSNRWLPTQKTDSTASYDPPLPSSGAGKQRLTSGSDPQEGSYVRLSK